MTYVTWLLEHFTFLILALYFSTLMIKDTSTLWSVIRKSVKLSRNKLPFNWNGRETIPPSYIIHLKFSYSNEAPSIKKSSQEFHLQLEVAEYCMCLKIVTSQVLSSGFGSSCAGIPYSFLTLVFKGECTVFPHSLASCFFLGLNYFSPLQFKPVHSQNKSFFPFSLG